MSPPTAIDSDWWTIRRPSTATGSTAMPPATTPTTPGGSGSSAGPRSRRSARTAGRVDVLHLHDWHTGPAAIFRDKRYADDPIVGGAAIVMTLHNLAYHGWTPRSRARAARAAAGRRHGRAGRRRHRSAARRASSGRAGQHGLARVRGRGAHAGLRDGARWRAARQGRPVLRDPQRPRHRASGIPATDADLAAPYRAAILAGRRPAGPIC